MQSWVEKGNVVFLNLLIFGSAAGFSWYSVRYQRQNLGRIITKFESCQTEFREYLQKFHCIQQVVVWKLAFNICLPSFHSQFSWIILFISLLFMGECETNVIESCFENFYFQNILFLMSQISRSKVDVKTIPLTKTQSICAAWLAKVLVG